MEYTARVHHESDGSHWAEVVELPGCFASGQSYDELIEALRESIELYLSSDRHVPAGQVGELKIAVAR